MFGADEQKAEVQIQKRLVFWSQSVFSFIYIIYLLSLIDDFSCVYLSRAATDRPPACCFPAGRGAERKPAVCGNQSHPGSRNPGSCLPGGSAPLSGQTAGKKDG